MTLSRDLDRRRSAIRSAARGNNGLMISRSASILYSDIRLNPVWSKNSILLKTRGYRRTDVNGVKTTLCAIFGAM
jgi:hypothetical protein